MQGVVLFQQFLDIKKTINNRVGLTDTEFKQYLKILGDVAPGQGNQRKFDLLKMLMFMNT